MNTPTALSPPAVGPSPADTGLLRLQGAATRPSRDLLEAAADGADMACLTPLEAFWAIKEVGLGDAGPMLAGLDEAQTQACFDLDCWRNGALDPTIFDAWLAATTRARGEAGGLSFHEALADAFLAVDEEVAVIFLSLSVGICERRDDDQDPPAGPEPDAVQATADNTLWVWSTAAARREVEPLVLVEALYRQAPATARRLLLAAQWELPAQLSEEALHFRQARLQDLGFPPPEQAHRLWARPQPMSAASPGQPAPAALPASSQRSAGSGPGLPAVVARGLASAGGGASLLAQAIGALGPAAAAAQLASFVSLVNMLWVARGQPAGDLDAISRLAELAASTVDLGLAARSPADTSPGGLACVLETWGQETLFQAGRQTLLPLRRAAAELSRRPEVADGIDGTEPDDDAPGARLWAMLQGLIQPLPEWAGFDPLRPHRRRPFARPADVERATELLAALARLETGPRKDP